MGTVHQFKFAPVSILWSPARSGNARPIRPSWRLLTQAGQVHEFTVPPAVHTPAAESAPTHPPVESVRSYNARRGTTRRTYMKWLARVRDADTPWSENEIIYFRKWVRRNMNKASELAASFARIAGGNGYRITDTQSERGRLYLLGKSLRRNGGKRAGCRLGDFELRVLRNLLEHRLVGIDDRGAVYRAIATTGEWFDYLGVAYAGVVVFGRGSGWNTGT